MRLVHSFINFATCIILLAIAANARSGELCGSKQGYFNQLTSTLIIPDYFPPETDALRGLVAEVDYEKCQRLAIVPLGVSCRLHDECYEQQRPKDQCDRDLQDRWVKECRKTYYKLAIDHFTCRLACEAFVKVMSEAQRYDSNGTCPSCEAYINVVSNQ